MPSFFCVAGSAVQSRPASQVGLPSGEGFSFESFIFLVLRFLRFRFSVTVMFLAFYTDIESSRVEQQQQQQQQQQHANELFFEPLPVEQNF